MKKTLVFLILILIYSTIFSFDGENVYIHDANKKDSLLTKGEAGRIIHSDPDKYYSDKHLGSFVENGQTVFRLFAPSAKNVKLVTFIKPEDKSGKEYLMNADSNGVWELILKGENYGLFYGYKVTDLDNHENEIALDPYAKAVATYNTYMSPRLAVVVKDNDYDWQGDKRIQRDWRDLIIYEMHIRDLTMHSSSGASKPGTYKGLVEKGRKGGIDYIKSLGVNTVEILPSQEFANIELPFKKKMAARYNTWNPYERNHWGYMTASFFAPEAYYAEDTKDIQWNTWTGKEARQINDFKDMVKAFHKEGIAVIMDVVYNHISEYEEGNLKEIDSKYYFRLDARGNYLSESGCGNDFKTERPMSRRMIIESILFWMKEYHVDGFRFDLGKMIDWITVEEIIHEAKKINPNVVIVCEPWGGGYDPAGFSLRGWGSWNDQIRNGIKGENPVNGHGWIFGKWYGNNNINRIKSYVQGTLTRDSLGLFQKKEHAVNYLESHDGYTFGDFIRIGTGEVKADEIIKDVDKNAKLSILQLKLNKLGALFLMTSQGITMISEGQEYGRSKVIAVDNSVKDSTMGMIDHNSYNKDNETNYLNFNHADMNKDLVNYYKGLIGLRKKYASFRRANYEDISFNEQHSNHFALGYHIMGRDEEIVVLFNADNHKHTTFDLPSGNWNIVVNAEKAGTKTLGIAKDRITVEPKTGFVLIKGK